MTAEQSAKLEHLVGKTFKLARMRTKQHPVIILAEFEEFVKEVAGDVKTTRKMHADLVEAIRHPSTIIGNFHLANP